jgi:hypothetical protein
MAFYVVLAHAAAAVLLGSGYFRRYRMARPPLGVVNLFDIALVLGLIVLLPYLYLALPPWLVTMFLAVVALSLLYFLGEPVFSSRWAVWLAALLLVGGDIASAYGFGGLSAPFFAVNNVVVVLVAVGAANLWAQSGMRARDAAVLAGALTLYDFIFTSQLTLMADLFEHVAGLPLAPMVGWPLGGLWLGLGLGDLLLATLFPLVMRKAYGKTAGVAAVIIALAAILFVLILPLLGFIEAVFPVMVVLGPLSVIQYLYWHSRGPERTTWQYLTAEPLKES